MRNLTCKTNPIQRTTGGNAVAAAAYRAGENLPDNRSGKMVQYERRSPDVRESFIRSVEDAPEWHYDRAALWNDVEATETRKNSRTGRDVVLGLAWELEPDQHRAAVLEFAQREFVDRGHVVDIAFHKYGSAVRNRDIVLDDRTGQKTTGMDKVASWRDGGLPFIEAHQTNGVDMPHVKIERSKGGDISGYKIYQPHAHVLVSPRAWDTETGAWSKTKERLFDKHETAMQWRYEWPKLQNRYLEEAGWDVKTSCTATGEGDESLPLKKTEATQSAHHMERRGEPANETSLVERNRMHNDIIRQTVADAPQSETEERTRRDQLMQWWSNFRDRLPEQKTALREKAAHYVRLLGGKLRPDGKAAGVEPEQPENTVEQAALDEPTHGHTWSERGDHEPDPSP